MDNISFTGFKNVKIKLDTRDRIVPCTFSNNVTRNCNAKYKGITINCDLFNSEAINDNHLIQFYELMRKVKRNFINPNSPQHLEMKFEKFNVLNSDGDVINISRFCEINGENVNLENPQDRIFLPLYTFMAKLTREINEKCNICELGHDSVKLANKIIHKSAVNFIENIM